MKIRASCLTAPAQVSLPDDVIPDDPLIDLSPLLALGQRVAQTSWAALEALPDIGDPGGITVLGAAHGWAGLLFAQLRFAEASRTRPQANLERRLGQLLSLAAPIGGGLALPRALGRSLQDSLVSSWCNGAAGVVPLYALAERVYREPTYLDVAERFGRVAIEANNDLGSVCCGACGQGFAALGCFAPPAKRTGEPLPRVACIRRAPRAFPSRWITASTRVLSAQHCSNWSWKRRMNRCCRCSTRDTIGPTAGYFMVQRPEMVRKISRASSAHQPHSAINYL